MAGVEAGREIQVEAVVERVPGLGRRGAVKLDLGPGVLASHRGGRAGEVEGDGADGAGHKRIGVQKQEGRVGQGSQGLDLVAMRVVGAEDSGLERQDLRAKPGQGLAAALGHPGVVLPLRPGLGFGDEKCAGKAGVRVAKRGGEKDRLMLQPT